MQNDSKRGPIVVTLAPNQWSKERDSFLSAGAGGNLPTGWILWRIYIVKRTCPRDQYVPVLIKDTQTLEAKRYKVDSNWIYASYSWLRGQI